MHKVFAIAILLLLTLPVIGQKIAAPSTPLALQPSTGIYQKVSLQLPPNAGLAEVRAAVLEMKPQVAALGCDLQLQTQIESPGGIHFQFAQTWQGIPIYQAGLKANLTHTKRFLSLLNHLQSFSGTPAAHSRSAAQVASLLPGLLDEGFADFHIVSSDLNYLLLDDALVACHRVVYTANTMSWEVLLADADLHELQRRDLAAYRRPLTVTPLEQMPLDTPGHAMVFNPDPLTTTGSTYGGGYVDNNDADSPELTAARRPVVLQDLTWNGSQFLLKGPYVEIVDVEAPTFAPVTTTDGNFDYTRNAQGFEDANVYYHLDTMQRYLQHLGFMNLRNTGIKADPHGVNGQDNSHFVPAGVDTRLGFGEGCVDDAEDADVIIHEYGHAISDAGSPGSNSGTERQGQDEGLGDYFAASYSLGLSYTYWKNTFTWDGHNPCWPGRSASNPTLYPPSSFDIYTYGEIWASVLMEVYLQIGKTASDRVVLQSLYMNAVNTTLSDAALAVLDADSLLYNGAHHDAYQQAFCTRGILTGSMSGQPCFVGVADATPSANLDWVIYPNPAAARATLSVRGPQSATGLQYRLVDLVGRTLLQGNLHGSSAELDLSQIETGIYWVELLGANGQLVDARNIVVE